jgi:hypothetical protein
MVDELLKGSYDEEDGKYYSVEEWYKKTWKYAMARVEKKSKESKEMKRQNQSEQALLPETRILVINKMIKVMKLLERKTKELEARLEVAEAKISELAAGKS